MEGVGGGGCGGKMCVDNLFRECVLSVSCTVHVVKSFLSFCLYSLIISILTNTESDNILSWTIYARRPPSQDGGKICYVI